MDDDGGSASTSTMQATQSRHQQHGAEGALHTQGIGQTSGDQASYGIEQRGYAEFSPSPPPSSPNDDVLSLSTSLSLGTTDLVEGMSSTESQRSVAPVQRQADASADQHVENDQHRVSSEPNTRLRSDDESRPPAQGRRPNEYDPTSTQPTQYLLVDSHTYNRHLYEQVSECEDEIYDAYEGEEDDYDYDGAYSENGSVSSLPLSEISSSFFFSSSANASPPMVPQHVLSRSMSQRSHAREFSGRRSVADERSPLHPPPLPGGNGTAEAITHSLIMPSLTLSSASFRQPTVYGRTLGDVRLIVLGFHPECTCDTTGDSKHEGEAKKSLAELILMFDVDNSGGGECNEDVVHVSFGEWTQRDLLGTRSRTIRASTDWVEHKAVHGLDERQPTRNIEVYEVETDGCTTSSQQLVQSLLSTIHSSFHALLDVLDPTCEPSGVLATLVASSTTPLWTGLVIVGSDSTTSLEKEIIDALQAQIPIIVLSQTNSIEPIKSSPLSLSLSQRSSSIRRPKRSRLSSSFSRLSSFRPHNPRELVNGLLRSPDTISTLRNEAGDRFLRWREAERVAEVLRKGYRRLSSGLTDEKDWKLFWEFDLDDDAAWHGGQGMPGALKQGRKRKWDKARWEREWDWELSKDVGKRMREGTITQRDFAGVATVGAAVAATDDSDVPAGASGMGREERWASSGLCDPLHLPSLLIFSMSLVGPVKAGIGRCVAGWLIDVKVALVGGFCVGLSLGIVCNRLISSH